MQSTTMKNIGLMTLMLAAVFAGTTTAAFAASDDDRREERREAMREMREEFRENLSEEQIEILEEARELHESGDIDSARDLLEAAGIDMPKKEMREDMKERNDAVRDAIEAGDYAAFQEATADAPVEMDISEEQFEGMVQAHELRESGDFEAARELIEELDLPRPGKRAHDHFVQNLSDDEKQIIRDAHELAKDGDVDGAKELLEDSGIELPEKEGFFKRLFGKKDK